MKVLDKVEEKLSEMCMTDEDIREEDARQLAAMQHGRVSQVDLPPGIREQPLAPLA